MGTQRTSNKDIADRLDTLIGLMTAQAMQETTPKVPTLDPVADAASPPSEAGTINVDEAYLAHMTAKAADHATAKGEDVVLYGRRNKQGETKLAYALRTRFDEVVAKQPSCLGAVGSFKA